MPGTNRRWSKTGASVRLPAIAVIALAWCGVAGATSTVASADPKPGDAETAPAQAKEPDPQETADDCGSASKLRGVKARVLSADELKAARQKGPPKPPEQTAKGPPPQWACNAETITLEPVWAGKPIEATWEIRNEGSGDLTIKLKRG